MIKKIKKKKERKERNDSRKRDKEGNMVIKGEAIKMSCLMRLRSCRSEL